MTGPYPANAVRAELVRIRQERGITQRELARRMNRTQGAVSLMERADRPEIRIDTLFRWARALDLDLRIDLVPSRQGGESSA